MAQRRRSQSVAPAPATASAFRSNTRFTLCAALGLLLLIGAVYGRAATFGFVSWDDNYHVVQNPNLNPPTLQHLGQFWRAPYLGLYAPLSYTLFSCEAWISQLTTGGAGLDPRVFHVGNLLLHAACCGLVFLLLARLTGHLASALVGAALFAVHPLQVESVAWISETRGLLSGVFTLAAIWVFVRSAEPRDALTETPAQRGEHWALGGILACNCLALLAKPSAAALPLVLLVMGIYLRYERRKLAVLVACSTAMSALWLVVTKLQQSNELMTEVAPLWSRPLIALGSIAFYAFKIVWPSSLGADYGWRPSWLVQQWWWYLLCIATAGGIWLLYRVKSPLRPAAALFAALLLPVLGFVPFGFQEISTVADRYAYVPLFAVSWAVAATLKGRWNFGWGFGASMVLGVLSALSVHHVGHWRNDEALFSQMVEVNPRSFVARMNVGLHAVNQGQIETGLALLRLSTELGPTYALSWYNLGSTQLKLGNYPEAVGALARARGLAPNKLETLNNLGRALIEIKQYEPAQRVLTEALQLEPQSPQAHTNLADAYLRANDLEKAEQYAQAATTSDGNFADGWLIYSNVRCRQGRFAEARSMLVAATQRDGGYASGEYALGELYLRSEDWAQAEVCFARACALKPGWPQAEYQVAYCRLQRGLTSEATALFEELVAVYPGYVDPFHGLAQIVLRQGETQRAIELYQYALSLQPKWHIAHQSLAWIYATSGDPRFRKADEARRHIDLALAEIERPGSELLDVLAAVQAARGSFSEAAASAERGIEQAKQIGATAQAQRIEQRLGLYRAGSAYIEAARVAQRGAEQR